MITLKKICTKCKIEKVSEEFNSFKLSPDGLTYDCKSCIKERSDKWYQENKERKLSLNRKWKDTHEIERRIVDRNSHLIRQYGINSDEYNKLLLKQNNRCAICGVIDPGTRKKYLSVDHNHSTGVVRGLLCDPCNNILGKAKDNVDILRNAISYLERNK